MSDGIKYLAVPFEIKAANGGEIEGYGSVFGNVDLGADIVIPGAFAKSIAEHEKNGTRPKMLWNHRSLDLPIGAWEKFGEDDNGLYMKGKLADTQMGRDVRTLAKMRAIDTMSIGYIPVEVDYDKRGNRLLKEIELYEVSPVNFAMNPAAVIAGVKSQFAGARDLEKHLREVGCSQKAAKDIVHDLLGSGARLDSDQREVDDDLLEAAKQLNDVATAALIRSQLRRQRNGKSHCRGDAEAR